MHTLNGKIAHLPGHLRDQLNRRLYDGQYCPQILPWLNALPIVKQVLADHFDGQPINHRNISNWRANGYQQWLEANQPYLNLEQDARKACRMTRAARGIAAGAAALAANKIFHLLQQNLSTEELLKAIPPVIQLVKAEHHSVRLKHDKKRLRQNDARIELARDKQQRDEAAIALRALADARAKDIEAGPGDYKEKLEILGHHMFGDLWVYRRPLPNSSSSSSSSDSSSKPDDNTTPKSDEDEPSSGRSRGDEALTKSDSSGEDGSNNDSPSGDSPTGAPAVTNTDPAQPLTECPERAQDLSRGSSANNVSATTPGNPANDSAADCEAAPVAPVQTGASPNLRLNDEAATFGLRPPEITPGKTTAQLIAEIEEYTALLAVRRKAFLVGRSRREEALTSSSSSSSSKSENATNPQPPAEILDATRHTHHASKPPLSDYEKALLEGKSQLEAMYAQITPTPEEFARRKRANEELRRASDPAPSVHQQSSINHQQFFGPCPPIYSWQGHRPLDRWKVHTS